MGWFKRLQEGIKTATVNKKEAPDASGINAQSATKHPL